MTDVYEILNNMFKHELERVISNDYAPKFEEEAMISTHKVEIVPISMTKHPDSDFLSTVDLFEGGYTVVVRTEDWKGVDKAAWLPPDSLVDTSKPEFAFLKEEGKDKARIKARRFRGILSYGLLVPAPEGFEIGDDVAEYLGVEHYNPPEIDDFKGAFTGKGVESVKHVKNGLLSQVVKYDVDSFKRYHKYLVEGEPIHVTEKLHGMNALYTYDVETDRIYAMSRSQWKTPDENSAFWRVLKNQPEIEAWLRENPDYALRGEVYGSVQKGFDYGVPKGEVRFAVFDIWHLPTTTYINASEFNQEKYSSLPWVPFIGIIPYNKEVVEELKNGKSAWGSHIKEGIVLKPISERRERNIGRVIFKLISEEYSVK